MRAHGWEVRRYRPPGVSPLEVWNLSVLGRELWELVGAPRVEAERRSGVPESELAGRLLPALVAALERLVPRHGADTVYLCGGLAGLEGLAPSLAGVGLPCAIHVAEEAHRAAVSAGLRLLEEESPASALAVDVGQTSIKCASAVGLRVFERDPEVLPILYIGQPRPTDGQHVRAAVQFIAHALHTAASELPRPPEALCLALPCPLDEALAPGSCTYGWEEQAHLVADILGASGLPAIGRAWVLNDAELGAEAARRDARVRGRRVLCLTLGFGPGGALLER